MPLYEDRITVELGMPELKVLEVKESEEAIWIKAKRRYDCGVCPECGKTSDRIHSHWQSKVRDMTILGKKTLLDIEKRRFRCLNGCRPFTEEWDTIAKYQRQTKRYQRHLSQSCRFSSVMEASRKEAIGYKVLDRLYYAGQKETPEYSFRKSLPKVLGIDEFSGKRRVRMHLAINDLTKRPRLWDVMETKGCIAFLEYFNRYSLTERLEVRTVVLDMDLGLACWVKKMFPLVNIVTDKFHLTRTLLKHLGRTRRGIYFKLEDKTKKLRVRKSCFLIKRRQEGLNEMETEKLNRGLEASKVLKEAYAFKEAFMKWYDTPKSRAQAETELCKLYGWLRRIPHLKRFSWALNKWWEPILNYFALQYTNGFAEGMNNKIKTLKRIGYGQRNFSRFRWRILKECAW